MGETILRIWLIWLIYPTSCVCDMTSWSSSKAWAAWYYTELLIKLMPKGVLVSFLFSSFKEGEGRWEPGCLTFSLSDT